MGKKLLVGCGVGCAVIIVIVVGIMVVGGLFVKDTVKGFNEAIESRQTLEAQHGTADQFTPVADGTIPAERIERFLAIRATLQPAREEIIRTFEQIPLSEEKARELEAKPFWGKMRAIFGITASGFGLAGGIGDFFDARNRALVEQQMGLGEYTYIYTTAYYAWLDHDLQDGPGTQIEKSEGGSKVKISGPSMGSPSTRNRLHRDLLSMLRNQLQALPVPTSAAESAWQESLAAEVTALTRGDARIPWQDGLPDAIAASLEPYRDELESSYCRETNPFELAVNRKQGNWSIQSE